MTKPPRVIRVPRTSDPGPGSDPAQEAPPAEITDRHVLCWTTDTARVYAMTADDLLGEWIPPYAAADYSAQKTLRLQHAVWTRTRLIDALMRAAGESLTAQDRKVMLTPASEQHTLANLIWPSPIPLVLIHGPGPHPTVTPPGRIIWLRPRAPEAYIRSLADAGAITLSIRTPDSQ